jgi:hypothetical protein
MPWFAAHLPDARVGLRPAPRRGVGEIRDERLDLRMQRAQPLAVGEERVEQLAVHVELHLVPRAVPDAHWSRVAPAAQMCELAFGQVVLAADAVHDLQRAGTRAPAGGARYERDEVAHLIRARPDEERVERHARVADPREAVIPVALAAHGLGQRGRRRRDNCSGRPVRQPFEHAGAEPHELAVLTAVDVVLGLPRAPRRDRVIDALGHVLGRRRLGRLAALRGGPAQREPHPLTGARGEARGQGPRLEGQFGACAHRHAPGAE